MKKIIWLILIICWEWLPAQSVWSQTHPVILNEIKTVGPDDPNDEFVELFNISNQAVDLSGYRLQYYLKNAQPYQVLYTFPDSTQIKPFHYYLVATANYRETKVPDGIMPAALLSNGQLFLIDSTGRDTSDAVAWGKIDSLLTREGRPAEYLEPTGGPSVAPGLAPGTPVSLHRDPEGNDSNDNYLDFKMRRLTTPMNSEDTLKLVLPASIKSYYSNRTIWLKWQTIARTQNLKFTVLQHDPADNRWKSVPAPISSTCTASLDTFYYQCQLAISDTPAMVQYKIKESDFTRIDRFSPVITVQSTRRDESSTPPVQLGLLQNYPNPFNNRTLIRFTLSANAAITLTIYNIA
ncbi:lamin tail domain-containing protein, partial [candidate division KSB1 bacterium]|nr:lamin tail domain-containing protein [candidate division KSB1 bacterium]